MLSGIGPKMHLALHDIDTIVEAPVGQSLQDHAQFFIGPFSFDGNKTTQPNLDRELNEDTLHEYLNQGTGEFDTISILGQEEFISKIFCLLKVHSLPVALV